jgi:hypothetical protein
MRRNFKRLRSTKNYILGALSLCLRTLHDQTEKYYHTERKTRDEAVFVTATEGKMNETNDERDQR